MAITGVMPLPALSNSILAGNRFGTVSGSTNSPMAWLIVSTSPTFSLSCKWLDTCPPLWRLTVNAMRRAPGQDDRL